MPLVTSEKMLADAQKGGYAVGAFNVENMEMVKAVIAAAEELHAPVMLQTTPSTIKTGRWRPIMRSSLRRRKKRQFRSAFTWTTAAASNWRYRHLRRDTLL